MTTNNKPATALPFYVRATQDQYAIEAQGERIAYLSPSAVKDAAYIAHACNAYPRLVEALQLAAQSMEDALRGGEYWQENTAKADLPIVLELLRRIGEETK